MFRKLKVSSIFKKDSQSSLSTNLKDSRISTINERGFTIIEMLVAVALFTVVAVVSVGSILAIVDANQKARSLKSVMDNLHFALQGMTIALQVGKDIDCDLSAITPDSQTDCSGGKRLNFRSADDKDTVYRFTGNRLERSVNGGVFVPLTAAEVVINDFDFYVVGTAEPPDVRQPLVIMTVDGTAGITEKTQSSFFVQTSVSSRFLDD
jgi:prepilin-type N-terminal cleavage/methylation domain-containing protein